MLDRQSLLELGAEGAATFGTDVHPAHAQEKPTRGGTLTIGRNHGAGTLYPGRSTGLSTIATNLLITRLESAAFTTATRGGIHG